MCHELMAMPETIPLLPVPPKRRLSFPLLILKTISNPIASWSQDFYDEPVVVYRSLGIETLYVMDPALIQTILLDDSDGFSKNPPHEEILGGLGGKGLLIAEGEAWRWQRRLAAPLFSPAEVARFVPAFADAADNVLQRWSEAMPGSSQPIDRDMTSATLQVLQDTVLGASLSEVEHQAVERFGTAFLAHTVWKIAFSSLGLPRWTPHPGALSMGRASRELRRVAQRVLDRRRQDGGEAADLLGRLVTARDPATGSFMPDSLIIDNVVTFLMAGHETTAQALTWTLYLLALFPEWQERAREEVLRVAGEERIGAQHMARLGLLEQIFQEAMRLYPPAPALVRVTSRAVKVGGLDLNPGANVLIPIYVVHRHRRLWSDPLRFDPTRFTPEASASRHRCAYMPFGAGPRTCIGGAFAMLEGKVMLASLLARARFELPQGERPVPFSRITLRPKGGLRLKVTLLRG
jgi:cytochrome P450